MPRQWVPGFSDIVWAKKAAQGSFRHGGTISPLKEEKLQTGFKALAGAVPKWNVICGQNESNAHVEIQVHKTAPINTLEALTETSVAATFIRCWRGA